MICRRPRPPRRSICAPGGQISASSCASVCICGRVRDPAHGTRTSSRARSLKHTRDAHCGDLALPPRAQASVSMVLLALAPAAVVLAYALALGPYAGVAADPSDACTTGSGCVCCHWPALSSSSENSNLARPSWRHPCTARILRHARPGTVVWLSTTVSRPLTVFWLG